MAGSADLEKPGRTRRDPELSIRTAWTLSMHACCGAEAESGLLRRTCCACINFIRRTPPPALRHVLSLPRRKCRWCSLMS